VVLFMSAVQLFGIAILGEYLRLIFLEVKGRPPYIVRSYKSADGRHDDPFDPLETQL
jgi:dolichol-phosphate mannosyltransferase